MKERPILFSAPMVRAILDGRKTQTRRVVKSFKHLVPALGVELDCIKDLDGEPSRLDMAPDNWEVCPYGVPGDRLWVRETGWEPPDRTPKMMRDGADTWPRYEYDADGLTEVDHEQLKEWRWKRRPSIHMPRWASRITLEITGVRVEKLIDITEDDAVAEGIPAFLTSPSSIPRQHFAGLWDSINGKGSFNSNPWVWVVEFRRNAHVSAPCQLNARLK